MSGRPERLFTPRFFLMCAFSFTVFLSAFQLLPTMPFRILSLGGSRFAAGLFLGFLTYASAVSAPFTGALADRVGKRRILIVGSVAGAAFAVLYALSQDYRIPLAVALLNGVFWSGLLSASAAYTTDIIPESRRAEGIGYWGLSTLAAIAVAPPVGFWIFERPHGWVWLCAFAAGLNLAMAAIAYLLPEAHAPASITVRRKPFFTGQLLEWRVLVVSLTLFLYSFGYGGITSFVALYADDRAVTPRGVYFTTFAAITFVARPLAARLADQVGHKRVLFPCLGLIVVGMALLSRAGTRSALMASAAVFGVGFGAAYPIFVAHVMKHVDPARRGAAFGAVLAAFDTGIGTGSIGTGWLIQRFGFPPAFGVGAVLSALAIPYFAWAERWALGRSSQ